MLINAQTKIAALLKAHPDALEAIVTLSPDFKKLRNPVLRKLMAGRTTIAMASKIGGCKPEDFFQKLMPLGFEADKAEQAAKETAEMEQPVPEFMKTLEAGQVITLDVREMLAGGNDPLKLIQQKIKTLQQGQVLKIINTFAPTPLIQLLQKQGFQAYVDVQEENLFETYFYKIHVTDLVQSEYTVGEQNDWELLLKQYENRLQQIDVRHLEMPQPMMTILETLEKLPSEKALFVHHKRIPVYLLTELKERGFDYRIKEVSDGEVQLLIFK